MLFGKECYAWDIVPFALLVTHWNIFSRKMMKNLAYEMTALYAERLAKRYLSSVPGVADAAASIATLFKKWDEDSGTSTNMLHFICSGMVQYSFFEALRRRIINDLAIPEHRGAAMSNLHNMQRILFRDDPEGV